jgi:hypothetical protein
MNTATRRVRRLAAAWALTLLCATGADADQSFNAFGPRVYGKGSTSESFVILDPSISYTMRIRSNASSGSISINGRPVVATSELGGKVGALERTVTLAATNTMDVHIGGNPASTLIVEIIGVDTIRPTVSITSPDPSVRQTSSPVMVTGLASDAQSGTAEVTCNGLPATLAGDAFTCSVALADGDRSILVEARDRSGNVGVAVSAFTLTTPSLRGQVWTEMAAVWTDSPGSAGFYKPVGLPAGFWPLGDYGHGGGAGINGFSLIVQAIKPGVLAAPVDYVKVWDDSLKLGGSGEGSFWKPIAPANFECLGLVVQPNRTDKPDTDRIRCVRADLVSAGKPGARVCCGSGSPTFPIFSFFLGSWQVIPADDNGVYVGSFTGAFHIFSPPPDQLFTLKSSAMTVPDVSDAELHQLIQTYGPIVAFHSQEQFLTDDPSFILDRPSTLQSGVVHDESTFDSFSISAFKEVVTSTATLLDDVAAAKASPSAADPDFKYWVALPRPSGGLSAIHCLPGGSGVVIPETCGSLPRTTAWVRVLPIAGVFLDIQYWFYFPFNGPGKFRVCLPSPCTEVFLSTNGRHFSDWEHVTERFAKNASSGQWELVSTFMSRHSFGEWAWVNGGRVSFDGTHPIFYTAVGSHAFYPTQGTQYYLRPVSIDVVVGTFAIDLFDLTDNGTRFNTSQPGHYSVMSSGFPNVTAQAPPWLPFQGRWGQYEKLRTCFDFTVYEYCEEEVGAGPTGPSAKGAFRQGDKPDVWEFPQ